ncbi:NADH-quinone oxidoreductase subunit C [Candidatus Marinimicrobia bacterium]|nr:NADH-quinone oxidoreductase subunit C [Candidatus Neomarinimicrobiota bacterium]
MLDKIIDIINKKFKDSILYEENSNYILIDNPSNWNLIADYLFQNNNLKFDYLMSLSGYDLTNDKVGVAYNFYSTKLKHYLEVRIEVDSNVEIPSVAELWRTANWHEREAYDLLGLKFSNHPDMKRILLPEDWDGHPLKKDYETPEFYNGMPVPKDKSYWE